VLNSEDLNPSGSGINSNNKLGMHIKSEEPATDPLETNLNNNTFGPINQSGPNRSLMSQNSPDRIQPLPSNVVNKQSNSMDVSDITIPFKNSYFIIFILVYATAKSDFCLFNRFGKQRS
jgi:hypothetical protein